MENGIYASHICKAFGRERVLRDVSLTVPAGKIVGIVGNNGCGKTVFMKCLCGFLLPDRGEVVVSGQHVGRDTDFPDNLGMIIETPGFVPGLSGYRNLRVLASLRGRIGRREIQSALERVGLSGAMKKPVSHYSLGMRQRLGIAQAIMEDPGTLILDEPFNGLDREAVGQMRQLLLHLKSEGKAIMLASHNAQDIATLCDDVLDMEEQKNA